MKAQPTILQKIFEQKKIRVEAAKSKVDLAEFIEKAKEFRKEFQTFRFFDALSDNSKTNIIAEIKRASPSKGIIKNDANVEEIAQIYEKGGAAAISVLTEQDFFGGSFDDFQTVRKTVKLPILRKDFIFDEFQIYESAILGADAILLIAAMLDDENLQKIYLLAEDLGIDVLVEVHDLQELERAGKIGAKIIGVNNRNLHNFEVSLDASRELIRNAPENVLMITESGLQNREDILELRELGFAGFLIGETLMKSGDTKAELRKLAAKKHEITQNVL